MRDKRGRGMKTTLHRFDAAPLRLAATTPLLLLLSFILLPSAFILHPSPSSFRPPPSSFGALILPPPAHRKPIQLPPADARNLARALRHERYE